MDPNEMDRDYIERNNLIERYALGQLSVEEQIRFEEYFAEDEECVAELEMAQDLRSTLRTVVAEDAQRTVGLAAVAHWLRRRHLGMLVAGLLLVALLPSLWLYSEQQQLRERLERYGSPQGAVLGIELTLDRGTGVTGPEVAPGPGEPWLVLIVDVGESDVETYSATLSDAEGGARWRDETLVPDPWGLLRILLPSDFLEAGAYWIDLEIRPASGPQESYGRFPFRYQPSGNQGSATSDPAGAADKP